MNRISGATVGDAEVRRLLKQVPNLDMNETEFDQVFQNYEDNMANTIDGFNSTYGFDSIDKAKDVLIKKKS